MKGDFSRSTFKRERHYSSVRMQQGRVQIDADWNEQLDIAAHHGQTTARDVIGSSGAPMNEAGFSIQPKGSNLLIGAGRYYVDGVLCENETSVLFTEQPDLPRATLPPATENGLYLAYLDVWERHITALEDPNIREVALGGPDTATRTKTVWQVKLVRVGDVKDPLNCVSEPKAWLDEIAPSTGQMRARSHPAGAQPSPRIIPPEAGYRGLENQLYRVEIHRRGVLGSATFKWSRENGSIVTSWLDKKGNDFKVGSLGRDKLLGFKSGDWVELADDMCELCRKPGTLVRLIDAKDQTLTIDPSTATGSVNRVDFPRNPKVRRWDMRDGQITVEAPGTNEGWIPLKDGVEVRFEPGLYETGDYWWIPARTATGDVEWPRDEKAPEAQPPHGIQHHYCRLALLKFNGTNFDKVADCRQLFPRVTELTSLFYVSGDGQEAIGDLADQKALIQLGQPLQVGVANGRCPVAGAKVRFEITKGDGLLQDGGQDP